MQDLIAWIKNCEALKTHTYLDSLGHVTIGWGRNLENGISLDEAELMFQNDLKRTLNELEQCSWYLIQPQAVKNALINMNFNLGIEKLMQFEKMIHFLSVKDYANAALEALDSRWAIQVGQRAKDIAIMIREGGNEG